MSFKRFVISGVIAASLLMGSTSSVFAQDTKYTVKAGDTFYLIGKKFGVSTQNLMKVNNATENTVLYPGNVLIIPSGVQAIHTVVKGDTYWTISQNYGVSFTKLLAANNANDKSWLNIGDRVIIPAAQASSPSPAPTPSPVPAPVPSPAPQPAPSPDKPYITYNDYTVKAGDTLWSISDKLGIPMSEVLKANNMTESTWLDIGQVIKIPFRNIPVKPVPGEQYGEYLDWWSEAQYVVPTQSVIEIVDFYTGKSFYVKRTTGNNHADVETLTLSDTQKMKDIWGGAFSWERRPVIVKYNGRKIAASMTSMPHAGNDSASGGLYTSWRSGDYGPGYNLDWVKNNGIDGVIDLHFPNSTRHSDGLADQGHQENIKISAGLR